jgi:hypothetical protein
VPQSPDDPICPICKSEAKLLDRTGDATGYECAEHGRFRLAGTIFAIPVQIDALREKWEAALKRARERQPNEWAPLTESTDFYPGAQSEWIIRGHLVGRSYLPLAACS